MKKVLMLSSDYLPNIGGISNHVYNLCKELDSKLSLNVVFAAEGSITDDRKIFKGLYIDKGQGRFKGLAYVFRFAGSLLKLRLNEYDVIHCHNLLLEGIVMALLKKLGIVKKLVFTNHSSQFLHAYYKNTYTIKLYEFLINSCDGIICPSEELVSASTKLIKKKKIPVFYIYNGVDMEKFTFSNETEGDIPVFLLTRRHEIKNGVIDLLKAVEIIGSELANKFKVIIIGQGSETEYLKSFCKDKNLDNVHFKGKMRFEDIIPYYQKAAYSCLPSHMEAVSISGLESLSCGTPVVGSNVGGIPAIVEDGKTGFLHAAENPESIASAILAAIKTYESPETYLEMRLMARNKVEEGYSWEYVTKETIKVYEGIT